MKSHIALISTCFLVKSASKSGQSGGLLAEEM